MTRFAADQRISVDGTVYRVESIRQEASKLQRCTLAELRNITRGVRKDQRFIIKLPIGASREERERLETFPERVRKLIEPVRGLTALRRDAASPKSLEPAELQKEGHGAQITPLLPGATWAETLSNKAEWSSGRGKSVARSLLAVLKGLAQRGMAHARLGASHLLISADGGVELLALEGIYAPALDAPAPVLPPHGYHLTLSAKKPKRGAKLAKALGEAWNEHADRFPLAVLMAELLAWHDPAVRELGAAEESEGLFPQYALGRESDRLTTILAAAEKSVPGFTQAFEATWSARDAEDMTPIAAWDALLEGKPLPSNDTEASQERGGASPKSPLVRAGAKTKAVSVFNFKGGVGKTTLTLGIAEILAAKHGKRVLVVDLDPQANSTCLLLDDERREAAWAQNHHVASFLRAGLTGEEAMRVGDAIQEAASPLVECKSVDLLASSPDLLDMELTAILREGSDKMLQRLLQSRRAGKKIDPTGILKQSMAGLIKSNRYDVIFFDCPPSFGLFTENALNASNFVLIPVTPEPISTQSMPLLVRRLAGFPVRIAGALINRVDNSRPFHARRVEALRAKAASDPGFPEYVFRNVMRNFARIEQMGEESSQGEITSLQQRYEYRCLDDLDAIAQELLERIGLADVQGPKRAPQGKKSAAPSTKKARR